MFPDLFITNPFSYFDGTIIDTATSTNQNGGIGGLTTLPSRIRITATQELNMTDAIMSGQNYLYLSATNQFDGSAGAQIASAFSDIALGCTNGFMTVTNLLEAGIPNWSGNIQAWSTRWIYVDATGVTNDFRVLLVYSQLQPTTAPWVNDLALYATNSLTVCDVLNVFGSLYFNARSLTLTTNSTGFGATSPDGEINTYFLPGSVGAAQWPHLQEVTNNGALRCLGQINFVGTADQTSRITNEYDGVVNNSYIADEGTVIDATNLVNGGIITNGTGFFTAQARTITLTNSAIFSGAAISLDAGSLLASNTVMQCYSLSLNPTNQLSDGGPGNGNIWVVGQTNATSGGLVLLNNPGRGNLLGTTITNICPPPNKTIANLWAGRDFGPSNQGFTNNSALGHLILDVEGGTSLITFGGAGSSNNALYVDCLEFRGELTNGVTGTSTPSLISYDFSRYLSINTNLVIYFARPIGTAIPSPKTLKRPAR